MNGERKQIKPEQNYGTLVLRDYDIDGNQIGAFYDSDDNLVFVLDNTINAQKPNVLLVINPVADKKWDEILSNDYGVDLENVRPKQDNKYQKLDIEYSGLNVYERLIDDFKAGHVLDEDLNQLNVLRDSASRHSAMTRLNAANEIIAKTNTTIVKTKETIVRLNERLKTLRAKLSATKKEIGRVNTKQSASVILKLESQIEATNEKLKRAKKRLESAQKRLEVATVDAELASNVLNQSSSEIKQSVKPVMVAPKYEMQPVDSSETEDDEDVDDNESDDNNAVEPLFNEDPQILNEDIAFKPISFNAPVVDVEAQTEKNPDVTLDVSEEISDKNENQPSVLESLSPISNVPEIAPVEEPVVDVMEPEAVVDEQRPVLETMMPIRPEIEETNEESELPTVSEYSMPVPESTDFEAEPTPVVEENKEETEIKKDKIDTMAETNVNIQNNLGYAPVAPINQNTQSIKETGGRGSRPTFLYYLLLFVLIVLSVFTLWLYQKTVKPGTPMLTAKTSESVEQKSEHKMFTLKKNKKQSAPVVKEEPDDEDIETVFVNEPQDKPIPEPMVEETSVEETEIIHEPEENLSAEESDSEGQVPIVEDAVPAHLMTSAQAEEEQNDNILSEDEVLVSKPIYEPGAKRDEMFIGADNYEDADLDMEPDAVINEESDAEEDLNIDAEEEQYQAEQDELYYEE